MVWNGDTIEEDCQLITFLKKKPRLISCINSLGRNQETTWLRVLKLIFSKSLNHYPPGIYLFKVSKRNNRTRSEICSNLTIKTPEQCRWYPSGVLIVNFEHFSHLLPVFLLLILLHVFGRFKIFRVLKSRSD